MENLNQAPKGPHQQQYIVVQNDNAFSNLCYDGMGEPLDHLASFKNILELKNIVNEREFVVLQYHERIDNCLVSIYQFEQPKPGIWTLFLDRFQKLHVG